MMTDILEFIRYMNFVWAFALFFVLIYYGILDVLLNRRCKVEHHVRELEFWALAAFLGVFALILSYSEIFLTGAPAGLRVFSVWPFLTVTSLGLRMGATRVRKHRIMVALGHCK